MPKPDFALRPPPLCEAISEVDYVRFIEKADEQVCNVACINYCNAIEQTYTLLPTDHRVLSSWQHCHISCHGETTYKSDQLSQIHNA